MIIRKGITKLKKEIDRINMIYMITFKSGKLLNFY